MPRLAAVLLLLAPALSAFAQEAGTPEPPGIQDNSFLIEESYNQEPGVVQHISSFIRSFDAGSWTYNFTQEWPVPGLRHQLSYTLPLLHGEAGGLDVGDIALNYRYQLIGNGQARLACAPRLTLLLPSGSWRREEGSGALGVQVGLPLSVVLSKALVTHANVGFSFVPSARNAQGDRANTTLFSLGGSLVWLARPSFNVLLEAVDVHGDVVVGTGSVHRRHDALLSPGLRWAYNFRSGLQIVPGLAVPIGFADSKGNTSLLVYLSFEHPFGHRRGS